VRRPAGVHDPSAGRYIGRGVKMAETLMALALVVAAAILVYLVGKL
jgi:hypothetical protein